MVIFLPEGSFPSVLVLDILQYTVYAQCICTMAHCLCLPSQFFTVRYAGFETGTMSQHIVMSYHISMSHHAHLQHGIGHMLIALAPGDNCVGEEGEAHTPKLSYNCMERKYFRKNFVKFEL